MKIEQSRGPGAVGTPKRATRANGDGSSFAQALDALGDADGAPMAKQVAPVDALLAAQEVDDATSGRKRAVARGAAVLERLEALRDGLVAGRLSPDQLVQLTSLLRSQRDHVADPELASLLEEIDLRAQVELAKLEMSGYRPPEA